MLTMMTDGLLSPSEAVLLSALQTVAFIAGFFLLKEDPRVTNDDPKIVRQRITYVLCVTAACVALVAWLLWSRSGGVIPLDTWFGVRLDGLLPALVLPVGLTAVLFTGPLVLAYCDEELPFQRNFSFHADVVLMLSSMVGLRTVIIAPIVEEIVFRACIVPLMVLAGFSRPIVIWCSPLFFGLAHFHKLRDVMKRSELYGKRESNFVAALLQTLFQCVYTTVFGWYTTFVFLRTGHIIACIACHAFCNTMGFPAFERISRHPRSAKVIWAAFVVGLMAFGWLLYPMTDPGLYKSRLWILAS